MAKVDPEQVKIHIDNYIATNEQYNHYNQLAPSSCRINGHGSVAQIQGYSESIKRIMDRKQTSPPGSVSGGTSASDNNNNKYLE